MFSLILQFTQVGLSRVIAERIVDALALIGIGNCIYFEDEL